MSTAHGSPALSRTRVLTLAHTHPQILTLTRTPTYAHIHTHADTTHTLSSTLSHTHPSDTLTLLHSLLHTHSLSHTLTVVVTHSPSDFHTHTLTCIHSPALTFTHFLTHTPHTHLTHIRALSLYTHTPTFSQLTHTLRLSLIRTCLYALASSITHSLAHTLSLTQHMPSVDNGAPQAPARAAHTHTCWVAHLPLSQAVSPSSLTGTRLHPTRSYTHTHLRHLHSHSLPLPCSHMHTHTLTRVDRYRQLGAQPRLMLRWPYLPSGPGSHCPQATAAASTGDRPRRPLAGQTWLSHACLGPEKTVLGSTGTCPVWRRTHL